MRVAHLILPILLALALTGASTASAASGGGGVGAGGASPSANSRAAGATKATANARGTGASSSTAPGATGSSGGVGVGSTPPLPVPQPTVPGAVAQIIHGVAYAPADAPLQVQEAIWAGDRIRLKPYRIGGGHGKWNDSAYDCSGSVSYVLHAAGLLKTSMDSSDFETWGQRGLGQWITVYTNPGHAFVQIAGIRLDTSAEQDPHPARGSGPRWRPLMSSTPGYMARHPSGF